LDGSAAQKLKWTIDAKNLLIVSGAFAPFCRSAILPLGFSKGRTNIFAD
jgi:hypothetical protein